MNTEQIAKGVEVEIIGEEELGTATVIRTYTLDGLPMAEIEIEGDYLDYAVSDLRVI